MNIAVINIKDILKYGIKLGIIIFLIYIFTQIFMKSNFSGQDKIKENIEQGVNNVNKYSLTECLDASISLMSYKKNETKEREKISTKKLLAMGAGIFDESIYKNTDLVINKSELTIDDIEEIAVQTDEIPKEANTEEVIENNIEANYTTSYKNVKINNQSKYEITKEILKPNVEIENKKDILIYHTHTCESYTPSERI